MTLSEVNKPLSVFSLVISATDKRAFQTDQAIGTSANPVCSLHYMEQRFASFSVLCFIQIVLFLLLYEYKDQSLVK